MSCSLVGTFFLADDLGSGDLACYGNLYAVTPNLDRLASARFTQFHVTGVMTGRHPASLATQPANGWSGDRATVTGLLKRIKTDDKDE